MSLAFVWGIHRGPVNSPHKWPVMRKMFPFDDVIMCHIEAKTKWPGVGGGFPHRPKACQIWCQWVSDLVECISREMTERIYTFQSFECLVFNENLDDFIEISSPGSN